MHQRRGMVAEYLIERHHALGHEQPTMATPITPVRSRCLSPSNGSSHERFEQWVRRVGSTRSLRDKETGKEKSVVR